MKRASTSFSDECPGARPSTVQSRALHRACQILGGAAQLAKYLGVSKEQLLQWLEARDDPPQELFLKAVDVILTQWHPREQVMFAHKKH